MQFWKKHPFQSGSFARWNHSYSWPQNSFPSYDRWRVATRALRSSRAGRLVSDDALVALPSCPEVIYVWPTVTLLLVGSHATPPPFGTAFPHLYTLPTVSPVLGRSSTHMFARQFCNRVAVRASDTLTRSFVRYKVVTYLVIYLLSRRFSSFLLINGFWWSTSTTDPVLITTHNRRQFTPRIIIGAQSRQIIQFKSSETFTYRKLKTAQMWHSLNIWMNIIELTDLYTVNICLPTQQRTIKYKFITLHVNYQQWTPVEEYCELHCTSLTCRC